MASDRPRLDARAAELKEKLLLSRRTRAPNTGSPAVGVANNAGSGTVASSSSPSSSSQANPPRKPSKPSVQVDGDDIAALIKSISQGSPPPSLPNNGNGKQVVKPALKGNASSSSSSQAATLPTPMALQTKTPVLMPPPAAKKNSPEEEGEVGNNSVKKEKSSESPVEKATPASTYKPRQAAPSSGPKAHRENPAQKTPHTPTKPVAVVPIFRERGNQTAAAQTTGSHSRQEARPQESMSGVNKGRPNLPKEGAARDYTMQKEPESSEDLDLRDWLVMTNYYDVEMRNRKLERHRKVLALSAEKERIETEQRKLIEEDEREMGFRSTSQMQGVITSATPAPNSAPHTSPPAKATEPNRQYEQRTPAKREFAGDANGYQGRPDKYQRYQRPVSRQEFNSPNRHHHRQFSPHPRDYSPNRLPRNVHRRSDFSDFSEHDRNYRYGNSDRRHDNHHHHHGKPTRETGPDEPPVNLDLGPKGDTRFFIVKSFNEQNVERCMEDGLWATQIHNIQTLTKAFTECKNVILFFSVNRSKAFQGYARMSSAPSRDTPQPRWMANINWETSDPFHIQWLSKAEVDFYRIGHLKNPYNEGNAVLIGKDGQEVEEECGRMLLKEMFAIAKAKYEEHWGRKSRDGGGAGSPRNFIKREEGEVPDYRDREHRGW